jgi:hypothetical protein
VQQPVLAMQVMPQGLKFMLQVKPHMWLALQVGVPFVGARQSAGEQQLLSRMQTLPHLL